METTKRRKTRVALIVAGALALAGAGHCTLAESRFTEAFGKIQRIGKGRIGNFAEHLLKGTSLLGGSGSDSAKKFSADKATKMSGTPLSLPLFFEANRGQTDPQVKFLARSSGYTLFVTPTETIFAGAHTSAPHGMLPQADRGADNEAGTAALRMKLMQSNPGPEISGIKELPGKVNYLIGNNPRDWHTGVPLYEEVRSREVYPGIDLVFHGDQQRLEYDFQVAPGADPQRIRFKIAGADKVALDENGDLVLRTGKNEFRMRKPVIYQQDGEGRRPVDGGFTLQAGKLVAFHVGAYDKKMPLVIDPTIIFATFLGAAGQELPAGMDLDTTNPSALRLYLSGSTTDVTTFAETKTIIGTAPGAGAYAFVAKIDPTTTGSASLDFLTFVGGNLVFTGGTAPCENLATDLKLDQSGGVGQVEAVLLGDTNCRDFPVTAGGPTTGTDDLFITRLTPSGAAIDGSTLFGGNGSAGLTYGGGASLFVNPEGSIVLSGDTTSTDFATTANAYSVSFNNGTPGGFDDCFIGEIGPLVQRSLPDVHECRRKQHERNRRGLRSRRGGSGRKNLFWRKHLFRNGVQPGQRRNRCQRISENVCGNSGNDAKRVRGGVGPEPERIEPTDLLQLHSGRRRNECTSWSRRCDARHRGAGRHNDFKQHDECAGYSAAECDSIDKQFAGGSGHWLHHGDRHDEDGRGQPGCFDVLRRKHGRRKFVHPIGGN